MPTRLESGLSPDLEPHLTQPLLQYNELLLVEEISHPEAVPLPMLDRCLTFTAAYCRIHNFRDVALNQFQPSTLKAVGLDGIPPRIIYYHNPAVKPKGCLILNPTVSDHYNGNRDTVVLESCGSIFNGKYPYFAWHSPDISVEGYVFENHNISHQTFSPDPESSDLAEHEITHLDGYTAIKKGVLSVQLQYVWEKIAQSYGQTADTKREEMKIKFPQGVVVFDYKTGRYTHIPVEQIGTGK